MLRRTFLGSVACGLAAAALLHSETAHSAGTSADTAVDRLLEKADRVMRGDTSAAVMKMHIKTKRFERTYEIVSWDDSRGRERTLIKILGPASWRGFGTLKIGGQLKLYDPKTNHVQVVGHSMLGSSWMGSHFTNDDLVKETRLARDFEVALDKKWSAPAPVGGGATYYLLKLTPKPRAPVAWGRIEFELWDNASGTVPTKARYFRKDSDSTPTRTIEFSDVKTMAGRVVPASMEVRVTDKPGEFTRIQYEKLKLNVKIPDSKFTEAALRR